MFKVNLMFEKKQLNWKQVAAIAATVGAASGFLAGKLSSQTPQTETIIPLAVEAEQIGECPAAISRSRSATDILHAIDREVVGHAAAIRGELRISNYTELTVEFILHVNERGEVSVYDFNAVCEGIPCGSPLNMTLPAIIAGKVVNKVQLETSGTACTIGMQFGVPNRRDSISI